MNKSLVGTFIALVVCAGALAQPQPPAPTDQDTAGLLGKDYASITPLVERFRHSGTKNGFGTNLGLNLPADDNFDVGFNYAFERASGAPSLTENTFTTACTGFFTRGKTKPFADLDLGYAFEKEKLHGISTKSNRAIYAAGAGFEAALTKSTAFVGRAAYNNSFKHGHHEFTYKAGLDQNLTDSIVGVVDVVFHQNNSAVYDLGVAFTF